VAGYLERQSKPRGREPDQLCRVCTPGPRVGGLLSLLAPQLGIPRRDHGKRRALRALDLLLGGGELEGTCMALRGARERSICRACSRHQLNASRSRLPLPASRFLRTTRSFEAFLAQQRIAYRVVHVGPLIAVEPARPIPQKLLAALQRGVLSDKAFAMASSLDADSLSSGSGIRRNPALDRYRC